MLTPREKSLLLEAQRMLHHAGQRVQHSRNGAMAAPVSWLLHDVIKTEASSTDF